MKVSPRLNGVSIKEPTTLGIEKYRLTKSGRVASGKMTMDHIARKRKFTFSYDVISSVDLDKILAIIDNDTSVFYTFSYNENNVAKSAIVYAGAIKGTKFRTGSIWYWKNVTFDLIEQ